MKRISTEEKINKIKTERKEMIEAVLNCISSNKDILVSEVQKVSEIINKDDENSKKYIEIVKIQELIESLSTDIINANTSEDIINIRKKLNYYINKVKSVMKSRGMTDEVINSYSEKVNDLRKSVSKYLRYVKRINNINEIDELNDNFDNLSEEELLRFKKLVKLENNYNNRILHSKASKTTTDQTTVDLQNFIYNLFKDDNQETKEVVVEEEKPQDISEEKLSVTVSEAEHINEDKLRDYIRQQIALFIHRYGVRDVHPYKDKIVKNVVSFIKNIPVYRNNKKSIHDMIRDFNLFYGGNDLYSFIAYTKENNSIRHGLKSIFAKTDLYSKDDEYLSKHEECIDWMMEFCSEQNLRLKCFN